MKRSYRTSVASAVALLLLLGPAAADKKTEQGTSLTKIAGQKAQVSDIPKLFVRAKRDCQNYAWAAVLESMLRAEDALPLKQEDWVVRSSNGPRCLTDVPDYTELVRFVPGDYVLDDGRKIRISAQYLSGAPSAIDPILWSFKNNKPLLLVWKGHPYFFYGVVYDEYIASNGSRLFELRELELMDPVIVKGKSNTIKFVKGSDNSDEINGMMTIAVSERDR